MAVTSFEVWIPKFDGQKCPNIDIVYLFGEVVIRYTKKTSLCNKIKELTIRWTEK